MALLIVWLRSMHTRNFFGVSWINELIRTPTCWLTLAIMPSAVYLSRASFSLVRLATGIRWTGIWTGRTCSSTWKWTGRPRLLMPSKLSEYWLSTSPFVRLLGGGRRQLEVTEGEGEGWHWSVVILCICCRWLHCVDGSVSLGGAEVPDGFLSPLGWDDSAVPLASNIEGKEWISSAWTLISPRGSLSLPERSAGFGPIMASGRIWKMRVSYFSAFSHTNSTWPIGWSGLEFP